MFSTDVQVPKTVDSIKKAIELGQSQTLAADVAKLTAMLAAGVAAEAAFHTYSCLTGFGKALSDWRPGKAASGREADIARSKALAGLVAAELVGQGAVIDGDRTAGNTDTLRFKEGIASGDVKFRRTGLDLVIAVRGTTDQVTLQRYGGIAGQSPAMSPTRACHPIS